MAANGPAHSRPKHVIEVERGRWFKDILTELVADQHLNMTQLVENLEMREEVVRYWLRKYDLMPHVFPVCQSCGQVIRPKKYSKSSTNSQEALR